MTREELINLAEVPVSEEDKKTLIDLLTVCDRILNKYPSSNDNRCSYTTAMSRAKDGIKDAKTWCESLTIQ